ncbi:MAG: hypothetical protein HKN67_04445 [Saprospiraceae bacterium]|nr:hypothetical protein [Saprospiraceae bacterium]
MPNEAWLAGRPSWEGTNRLQPLIILFVQGAYHGNNQVTLVDATKSPSLGKVAETISFRRKGQKLKSNLKRGSKKGVTFYPQMCLNIFGSKSTGLTNTD